MAIVPPFLPAHDRNTLEADCRHVAISTMEVAFGITPYRWQEDGVLVHLLKISREPGLQSRRRQQQTAKMVATMPTTISQEPGLQSRR